jgi:hypothetical protein
VEEGSSVVAPAAALRPSAEWNPPIRMKPRMDGAPGKKPRMNGAPGNSVVPPAASLRPSAEWNPPIRKNAYGWGTRRSCVDGGGGVEEGSSVVAPAAALRPSAEWNPPIRKNAYGWGTRLARMVWGYFYCIGLGGVTMPGFGEVNRQCLWGVWRFWGWQGLDRFCAGLGVAWRKAIQSFRLRLHSGLRQSGGHPSA